MWLFFWTQYKASKFATFLSFVGMMTRYAGVTCLFSGLIPAGLICIAIGSVIHFGASAIAKSKVKKITGGVKKEKPISSAPKTAAQQAPKATPKPNPAPAAPAKTTQVTAEQKRCNKCGAIVSGNNMFCTECGNKFTKEKKCIRCGKVLTEEEKFCGQCGYQVK